MLKKCPECDLQVSDKALTCPHCGYPLAKNTIPSRTSTKKHRRLPNGFGKVIESLGLNREHRPHDPRKTFITRCKKADVDINALKQMVGHSIKDITESVYTVRDVEWLRKDLEKMQ